MNTDTIDIQTTENLEVHTIVPAKPKRPNALLKAITENSGAILFLILPTLLAIIYYSFIATDMYESEGRFIVRSSQQRQMSMFANFFQQAGLSPTHDSLFIVHEFITSRDGIKSLQKHIDLKNIYGNKDADFLSQYPNILNDNSFEGLYEYYSKNISIVFDSATGITTLTARAFSPDDAQLIVNILLDESEGLVNRLNERSRNNAIGDAEKDVQIAEEKVTEIQLKMLNYRNREEVLDPKSATEAFAESLAKLRVELIMSRARLSEMQQSSPSNPMIRGLKAHINSIERQYNNEMAKLTGDEKSLAPKVGMYEELVLRQEFAAKQLASAVGSLASAKAEARRQLIYLDRVVEPNVPDEAKYPQKFKSICIIFMSLFLMYSISRLLMTGLREHSQR